MKHFPETMICVLLTLLMSGVSFNYKRKYIIEWGQKLIYPKSITKLENLERFESHIAKAFLSSINVNKKIHPEVQRLVHLYLKDYFESSGRININTDDASANKEIHISKNPICTYRLLRRVQTLLKDMVFHKQFCHNFGVECSNVAYYIMQYHWPKPEDLEMLAENILRIHNVYDLDAEQFTNGWISTAGTNCSLNSIHCYEISFMAIKTDQFTSAIQWLELAKEKTLVDKKTSMVFIEYLLWKVIEQHNMEYDESVKMELEPVFFDREINHIQNDFKNATKLRNLQYKAFKGSKERYHAYLNFQGVCSGDTFQTDKQKSHLFCCVVSYQEATNRIQGSNSSFHLSLTTSPCKHSNARHLEKKLEALTGLVVSGTAAETLSLLSYSVGAHLNPHFDKLSFMDLDKTPYNFRLASIMLYLSDVELGGATVFTSLGINAEPIKGSLLLWYNFFTDGSSDFDTFHGGCPVILGAKWAANKWVKYGTQLQHKCSLKRQERFQFAVNNVYLPMPSSSGEIPRRED
ncbi:unnamed protein product [Allacma fusca]|uniref:procollagen-proline 4-dioxygenase n=1 Tax=Allacma fusca TaxID=39272 RepID=A0A8J2LUI1_9HEXA|nr:unnamed protein product [Allacma fusca]